MRVIKLIQGTPEWIAHRMKYRNASDAPAMMACSPNKKRSELVREIATGISPEFSDFVQKRILDKGHDFEKLARPLADAILDEELFPVTAVADEGIYGASFDGITVEDTESWEHKRLNVALREAMIEGCVGTDLPLCYQVQMEHQCMVGDSIERVLFMASEWTGDGALIEERHCWYTPNPVLRAQIVAGWEQLEKDVAAYVPEAAPVVPITAAPIESLPAIAVQLQGSLAVISNLEKVTEAVHAFIDRMVPNPSTDQEFADADAECKALKKGEDAIDSAVDNAIAQVEDVEAFKRAALSLKLLMTKTRLAREKVVAAEKEFRKNALTTDAQQELAAHIKAINDQMGAAYLPPPAQGIFGPVIKGLKSFESMTDKVRAALAQAIGDANATALRLRTNRDHLKQDDQDWITLFSDFGAVGTQAAESFQALAAYRIGLHKAAEQARLDAALEKIRIEEEAKATAKAKAETESAAPPAASPAVVTLRPVVRAPVPAPTAVPMSSNEVPTLNIGAINDRLEDWKVTEENLRNMGFTPSGKKGPSPLYRESDYPAICRAIADRALTKAEQHESAQAVA